MKTLKNIKYVIGIIAAIFIVACTVDTLENSIPEVETNVIDNPDYEIIRSMGFQTEGITEWEDFYIVEGDIIIDKVDIDSLKLKPATRQARYKNYITNGREESIRVKITSNNIPDASWRRAVRDAVDLWNSVPNCRVRFYKIEKEVLYHDVKVEMSTSTSVAAANTPVNGRPGKKVL